MPAIQLEVELTIEQLLQAIEQLTDDELMQFEAEYPKRILKRLSEIDTMSDLRSTIAYRFPKEKQERLDDLIDKNNAGTITEAEHRELAELVEEFDQKTLGGSTTLDNLALACPACNMAKYMRVRAIDPQTGRRVALFHPRRQRWTRP